MTAANKSDNILQDRKKRQQQRDYALQNGLCPYCLVQQTQQRVGGGVVGGKGTSGTQRSISILAFPVSKSSSSSTSSSCSSSSTMLSTKSLKSAAAKTSSLLLGKMKNKNKSEKTSKTTNKTATASWEPLTILVKGRESHVHTTITTSIEQQNYLVYKGYCLSPTCPAGWTLEAARRLLGESEDPSSNFQNDIDDVVEEDNDDDDGDDSDYDEEADEVGEEKFHMTSSTHSSPLAFRTTPRPPRDRTSTFLRSLSQSRMKTKTCSISSVSDHQPSSFKKKSNRFSSTSSSSYSLSSSSVQSQAADSTSCEFDWQRIIRAPPPANAIIPVEVKSESSQVVRQNKARKSSHYKANALQSGSSISSSCASAPSSPATRRTTSRTTPPKAEITIKSAVSTTSFASTISFASSLSTSSTVESSRKLPPITAFFLRQDGMEIIDNPMEISLVLRDHRLDPQVTCLGLTYLRKSLCKGLVAPSATTTIDTATTGSSSILRPIDEQCWIQQIQSIRQQHYTTLAVNSQVVRTIVTFASFSNTLQQIMIQQGYLPLLLDILKNCVRTGETGAPKGDFDAIAELCCNALNCITSSPLCKTSQAIMPSVDALHSVMRLGRFSLPLDCFASITISLFHIVQTTMCGADQWRRSHQNYHANSSDDYKDEVILVLLELMSRKESALYLQYAALYLLSKLFFVDEIDPFLKNEDYRFSYHAPSDDGLTSVIQERLITDHLAKFLNESNSAVLELLGLKMLLTSLRFSTLARNHKKKSIGLIINAVLRSMGKHIDDEALQVQALATFLFIVKEEQQRQLQPSSSSGFDENQNNDKQFISSKKAVAIRVALFKAMQAFPDSADIAGLGSHIYVMLSDLSSLSLDCQQGTLQQQEIEYVENKSLVKVLLNSFHKCVEDNFGCDVVRTSVSAALATLCYDQDIAQEFARTTNLLIAVDRIAKREKEALILTSLFHIFGSLLLFTKQVPWSAEAESTNYISPYAKTSNLTILQRAFEVKNDTSASSAIRLEALALLDTIYRFVPFRGKFGQTTAFRICGGAIAVIQTHNRKEAELLCRAVRSTNGDPRILAANCSALSSFYVPCCNDVSTIEPEAISLAFDTAPVVFDSLLYHRHHENIVRSAVYTFWTLVHVSEHPNINPMWFESLVDFAECHNESVDVHVIVSSMLSSLIQHESEIMCDNRALELFLRMIRNKSLYVALLGCRYLLSITSSNLNATVSLSKMNNVAATFIVSMETHINNVDVQECICLICSCLIGAPSRERLRELANCGGLKALVDSLNFHHHDLHFIKPAIRFLAVLVDEADADVLWTHRYSVSEALINALSSSSSQDDKGLSTSLLDILSSIFRKEKSFKSTLGPAIPALSRLMNRFSEDASFLMTICHIIGALACIETNLIFFQDCASMMCLCNSILIHPENTDLVVELLRILSVIGTDSKVKNTFRSQIDIEEVVICVMRIHYQHPQVLATAFAALNNFVVCPELGTVVTPMNDEILRVVLSALKWFAWDMNVARDVAMLLQSYSYDSTSLICMKHAKESLIHLLDETKSSHKDVLIQEIIFGVRGKLFDSK